MEEKRGYLSKIDSEKNAPTTTTDRCVEKMLELKRVGSQTDI